MNTLYSLRDDLGLKKATIELSFDEVKRLLRLALDGTGLEVTDWESFGLAITIYADRPDKQTGTAGETDPTPQHLLDQGYRSGGVSGENGEGQ